MEVAPTARPTVVDGDITVGRLDGDAVVAAHHRARPETNATPDANEAAQ